MQNFISQREQILSGIFESNRIFKLLSVLGGFLLRMLHHYTQEILFLFCKRLSVTRLQRALYPLLPLQRYIYYNSKLFMSQLPTCNTDETFWQMCFTVIRLKKPPANVCRPDESLEHCVLEEYSAKLEGSVLC